MVERLPNPTTPEGLFEWIIVVIVSIAVLAAVLLAASTVGLLPPVDEFDGSAGLVVLGPASVRIRRSGTASEDVLARVGERARSDEEETDGQQQWVGGRTGVR